MCVLKERVTRNVIRPSSRLGPEDWRLWVKCSVFQSQASPPNVKISPHSGLGLTHDQLYLLLHTPQPSHALHHPLWSVELLLLSSHYLFREQQDQPVPGGRVPVQEWEQEPDPHHQRLQQGDREVYPQPVQVWRQVTILFLPLVADNQTETDLKEKLHEFKGLVATRGSLALLVAWDGFLTISFFIFHWQIPSL